MGDRAFIGRKTTKGYEYVYLHWNGDVALEVLRKHYKSPSTVKKLISMGGISFLAKKIGKKYDFFERKRPANQSSFYSRDRGDEKIIWKSKTLKEIVSIAERNIMIEYVYIYSKGKWKAVYYAR